MRGLTLAVVSKAETGPLALTVQVRFDRATVGRIDAVARETGRKRSDVVRILLITALDLHESEKRGKK